MTKQRAGQRARAPTVFCRPRRRRGLPSLSSFESVCDARRLSALAPAPHADAGELVRVLGARGLGRDDLSPDSPVLAAPDRKSTRLNSSHANISYAVFCLKKKKKHIK